jgi:uncharacterized protein YcbK (DUF882 family)
MTHSESGRQETNYFDHGEFACRCGCGTNIIDGELVSRLNMARGIARIPFRVTSGCRCETHNRDVGGVDSSAHVLGYAADIAVRGSRERYAVLAALIAAGFKRIGIAHDFVHADIDPGKNKPVIWRYR